MAEVIGIDLGGTKILARFVDPVSGKSDGRVKRSTPKTGPADVLDKIVSVVDAPAREAGEVIEDEGDAHERIVSFLEELKVL